MPTAKDNYQQGIVMALNGWSTEDIQSFSVKLNIPDDVTDQFIEGHTSALKHLFYCERITALRRMCATSRQTS
ncbi:hypothetical protein [Neptunomonas qingdaonensis]|uniref:Uncharacterized protein n=1 Tax=Neptunomonas qingdaonensis TaxID=1045558 RepID=A0A1I2MCI3_9GAMM|nr:hypothetical protein [Neptunomonas qingdaonensis]SFF88640.1 hypothetical protein SAMN05216175_101528 [Neptunomonas qingdaonensis]